MKRNTKEKNKLVLSPESPALGCELKCVVGTNAQGRTLRGGVSQNDEYEVNLIPLTDKIQSKSN